MGGFSVAIRVTMFWGRGDSSKLEEGQRQLLDDLRRLEETGHIVTTTPEQSRDALSAIRFFGMLTSATGLLAGMRNVSMWVGGALVAWWAVKEAVIEFIKKAGAG